MDVSIIIRTKNEGEFIEQTLRKLHEQDFIGDYEIIIVDSGSTDSTLDIISRYDVRLVQIPQEEFTYGRSLNIGASNARGEFIVSLSAHAFPRNKEWLTNIIAGFEDNNVAGVYGRQLSDGTLNPFEALLNEFFFGQNKLKFNLINNRMLKRIHFTNSNAAIRKSMWQRFKFNERVLYGEDVLWQDEIVKASFSIVYAPDAAVYHTHRLSIRSVYKNSVNCAYNLSLIGQKRRWISLIAFDVVVFLGFVPISLIHNLEYVWRNDYKQHARVVPLWVLATVGGSLVGKINYRLKRQLW